MENRSLLSKRMYYKPYWYIEAQEFTKNQQRAHWLPEEVPLASDVSDWKTKLTESEKNLIGNILKSFAQTEIHVGNDYWINRVAREYHLPEIQEMAVTFASMECIHAEAYARLNEELGLDDFKAFLEDEASKAKIDRLIEVPGETLEERALSLAIFSAFTEGVNLFSSFAILMSFQLRNLMKGTGQVVEWSVRDESLHSKAGCWLYKTLLLENPSLATPELRNKIIEACELSVNLEFDFIEKAFEMGDIEGLNKEQLKTFIKARANEKMVELGYKGIYNDIDPNLLRQMDWFGHLTSGRSHTDFFASRVTDYSKSTADWSDL
jgi:ribonucleoside-diphosphate reductase beta chain